MQRCYTVVADNIAILKQGIELTSCLGHLYSSAAPRCLQGGIGAHFRHCIDFYNCFLSSAASGRINYDSRARNELVESDPELAAFELQAIIDGLRSFSFAGQGVWHVVRTQRNMRVHLVAGLWVGGGRDAGAAETTTSLIFRAMSARALFRSGFDRASRGFLGSFSP